MSSEKLVKTYFFVACLRLQEPNLYEYLGLLYIKKKQILRFTRYCYCDIEERRENSISFWRKFIWDTTYQILCKSANFWWSCDQNHFGVFFRTHCTFQVSRDSCNSGGCLYIVYLCWCFSIALHAVSFERGLQVPAGNSIHREQTECSKHLRLRPCTDRRTIGPR